MPTIKRTTVAYAVAAATLLSSCIVGIGAAQAEESTPDPAKSYYVDCAATANGDGSLASPVQLVDSGERHHPQSR